MTELYEKKKVKIRKPHQCCVCLRKIPKGFKCIHHSGKTEDGFFNYYTCNTCNIIANEYPKVCVDEWEGYVDEQTFADNLHENKCTTPLQLLNKLRKNEAVIL